MIEATTTSDRQRATAVLLDLAEDTTETSEIRLHAAQSVLHAPMTSIADPTLDELADKIAERLATA